MSGQQQQGDDPKSKGLLPAVGVGAAVYAVTGLVSLTTLGLVGIGAGVGYGVGSWLADKYEEKKEAAQDPQKVFAKMPPALQVALGHWQAFLAAKVPGRQPTHAEAEALFAEFAQAEPFHAHQVRDFVHSHGGSTVGRVGPAGSAGSVPVMKMTAGGAVPVAAEV
jgi:hypothetical protein